MAQRDLRYTLPADAWEFMKKIYESEDFGHRFGEPRIEEFTFVGTKYTADCLNCGRPLYVHGGFGGPAAFGPIAHAACAKRK